MTTPEDFNAHVRRLIDEGKLTPEDAQALLSTPAAPHAPTPPLPPLSPVAPDAPHPEPVAVIHPERVPLEGDAEGTPDDLHLRLSGYGLHVLIDSALTVPELTATHAHLLRLCATPQGWLVERTEQRPGVLSGLRATLRLPFTPRHVRASVAGGSLHLPDVTGDVSVDVGGGSATLRDTGSLIASVGGGSLTAHNTHGPARITVGGGSVRLHDAHPLTAQIGGGSLQWAPRLNEGDHHISVAGGSAKLHLQPGSSVRVDASITAGGFSADFPTTKSGNFITSTHTGTLRDGAASLTATVAGGALKVVSA
ncbi:hypothetical protein [Deinococcus maricopensis]|uniref:Adhesin domain-containing protein n=1 Tax=Deinococcus maricopensis (strain DSM 21211 / LMG 22137 / NRRL B-23946 / LB-34) TaxID=709986 RepID=E8U598_DEIML|nr:hypothetical protein [Deinococcus maricopensis]ADV66237.1 hypothetical protein Deima_0578 [Deinococcus maricopensis DSM 21211]